MDMQNVSNLTIPEGQVRTIHDKDSRLIWGRVAYNTKYAGDTFQQTYSGKNLFNYQGVVNLAIATTIAGKSTYRGYYIQANAGDTFTLSRATTTGNNRFRVCFTMVEPARGVEVYNENGVVERYISADGATEVSFTVPQDMHYVFIYLSSSGQDITESLKIQLETGSTATAYEPYVGGNPAPNPDYPQNVQTVTGEQTVTVSDGVGSEAFPISLGSIELCKIGGYQDYIYKSSDDWYVHKEFVKYYLSDFTFSMERNASNYRIVYQTQLLDLQKPASNDALPIALCSHYGIVTANDTWRSVQGVCMSQSSRLYIYDNSYNQSTSANDYNSWIQDNRPSLFWKLATATDTKITDVTLVSQLNAVHEWLTRYGYNATVTGNLPLIVNRTNL